MLFLSEFRCGDRSWEHHTLVCSHIRTRSRFHLDNKHCLCVRRLSCVSQSALLVSGSRPVVATRIPLRRGQKLPGRLEFEYRLRRSTMSKRRRMLVGRNGNNNALGRYLYPRMHVLCRQNRCQATATRPVRAFQNSGRGSKVGCRLHCSNKR